MVYTCYNDLKNNILKYGDSVQFKIVEKNKYLDYRVYDSFLGLSTGPNNEVFTLLEVDSFDIASECYGYKSKIGGWPEFRLYDFKAATRLVLKLYEIIEGINISVKNQNNENSILIPAKKYKQTNKIPENTEIILTV